MESAQGRREYSWCVLRCRLDLHRQDHRLVPWDHRSGEDLEVEDASAGLSSGRILARTVRISRASDLTACGCPTPTTTPSAERGKMGVPALVEFSMSGRLLTTGCVAAAALAVAHAQQQPPPFGTTTRTVAVYATVTDSQGRLAPD